MSIVCLPLICVVWALPAQTVDAIDLTQQEYACPMHPKVVSKAEGVCPRCGLPLQPVPFEVVPAGSFHLKEQWRVADLQAVTERLAKRACVRGAAPDLLLESFALAKGWRAESDLYKAFLTHPEPSTRRSAATALKYCMSDRAKSALEEYLRAHAKRWDRQGYVCPDCKRLTKVGRKESGAYCLTCKKKIKYSIEAPFWSLYLEVAKTLHAVGSKSGTDALLTAWDRGLHEHAILGLAFRDSEVTAQKIEAALKSDVRSIRSCARAAQASLHYDAAATLASKYLEDAAGTPDEWWLLEAYAKARYPSLAPLYRRIVKESKPGSMRKLVAQAALAFLGEATMKRQIQEEFANWVTSKRKGQPRDVSEGGPSKAVFLLECMGSLAGSRERRLLARVANEDDANLRWLAVMSAIRSVAGVVKR